MKATCLRTCYDRQLYEAGNQYDIDPEAPYAVHFGFGPKEAKQAKPAKSVKAGKKAKEDDGAEEISSGFLDA